MPSRFHKVVRAQLVWFHVPTGKPLLGWLKGVITRFMAHMPFVNREQAERGLNLHFNVVNPSTLCAQ